MDHMAPTGGRSVADYVAAYARLTQREDSFRVALVGNFTMQWFQEALAVQASEAGIPVEVFVGGYKQYAQEILNPESDLYAFRPNMIFLCIDFASFAGDMVFLPYAQSVTEREAWVLEQFALIRSFIDQLENRLPDAVIIPHTFLVPSYSPLGILEEKEPFGFRESVRAFNEKLFAYAKQRSRVYVFDFDRFASAVGVDNVRDDRLYYLGDFAIAPDHIPALTREYFRYIRAATWRTKKCIVLDLDNTLWGGVVGEDGIEGIRLGPTPEGRPYFEFQKHLLSLFQRGIILAVNSKNNEADALKVFREHPYMVLKETQLAAVEINWNDKVDNLKRIAETLNIGLDSLVFIDDDPLNCAFVREALPEVAVVELPKDPAHLVRAFTELPYFDALQMTDEDKIKGRLYADEKKRTDLRTRMTSLEEYLKSLSMVMTIAPPSPMQFSRVAQLTQKTNQFTMTTRRYLESDIERFVQQGEHRVYAVSLSDSFGDSGLIGVVIVLMAGEVWRLDSFLLSCRVIGRGVEDAILAHVIAEAKIAKAERIIGEFISTKKNQPAQGFFVRSGFTRLGVVHDVEEWEYDTSRPFPMPEHIQVNTTPYA